VHGTRNWGDVVSTVSSQGRIRTCLVSIINGWLILVQGSFALPYHSFQLSLAT